jgi:glucose-6-phosphate dehydrogenase assembly protein OpcA
MSLTKLLYRDIHISSPLPVSLTDIEKELAGLWNSLSQEAPSGYTLTRACMSNLVIYCETRKEADAVVNDLPKILEVHPARILLLIGEAESDEDELKAYLSIYYSLLSGAVQLCAEQVTVFCRQNAARRLPSIPRALCMGDLPTALWWASSQPPPLAGDIFYNLAESADQVIFDSIGWKDPVKGVLAVAQWLAGNCNQVIYNLAWRRLKSWRKLISETLDPRVVPGALSTVSRLEIEHGPHALPVAWLLVGWLAARLGWQPVDGRLLSQTAMTWRFACGGNPIDVRVKRRDEGDAWIDQLSWSWRGDNGGTVVFSQLGERKLGVRSEAAHVAETVVAMPDLDHAGLLAAQMAHRFHDELFEDVLAVSNRMAAILLE